MLCSANTNRSLVGMKSCARVLCQQKKYKLIYYLWRPNLKDEADNHLIELAIAGNAKIIASNNIKDFKQTQLNFPELLIKKPDEMINI